MDFWQRVKRRKISFGLLLIILAWLVLPTGDPSDVLITLPLIGALGLKVYLVLAAVILAANIWINGGLISKWLK